MIITKVNFIFTFVLLIFPMTPLSVHFLVIIINEAVNGIFLLWAHHMEVLNCIWIRMGRDIFFWFLMNTWTLALPEWERGGIAFAIGHSLIFAYYFD